MLLPLQLSLVLVLCTAGVLCFQNRAGFSIRVTLSDYSNPHQVLADYGQPCDSGTNYCDPYFEVQLGTQQYSYKWQNESKRFPNVYNLTGEFFTTEFQVDQQLPDSLFIGVTITDYDYYPSTPEVIARPQIELAQLLPSIPGRSNARKLRVDWTPLNRYVSFTLTVEVTCWPGLFGRRCSTPCSNGEAVYPTWDQTNPATSLEITECRPETAPSGSATRGAASSEDKLEMPNFLPRNAYIGIVCAAVGGALVLILTVSVCVATRRKRQLRAAEQQIIYKHLSHQTSVASSVAQPYGMSITNGGVAVRVENYPNPVYTGSGVAGDTQRNQTRPQARTAPPTAAAAHDSETFEDIYEEEFEDPRQKLPPLPPRMSGAVESS